MGNTCRNYWKSKFCVEKDEQVNEFKRRNKVSIQQFFVGMGLCTLCCGSMAAQSGNEEERPDSLVYRAEVFGSVATGSHTPFWMVSNRYGLVPLDAGNGYLRAGVFNSQSFGYGRRFRWNVGVDAVAVAPRYKNVYIQQLYAGLGYRSLLLSIGSKEDYTSLWDRKLSSGDMVQSANARPIPEVNLSIPEFAVVPYTKGWLQVKGDFAVGRSFDTDYLEHVAYPGEPYIRNVLWHHKSFFVQIADTEGGKPFSAILGIRHAAQWGGTSTDPQAGKQPQSLKDLLRVIVGKEGGSGASQSSRINVLGNHYGSYDLKLAYRGAGWKASLYWQHYFEDTSGMEFANARDGLWGAELELFRFKWVRKVVFEFFDTRYQSGPFHFIEYVRPGRGGGADNYYNNGEYVTGVSYFGQGLGSPLITSPEYNTDGFLGFENNRVKAFHLGMEGSLSPYVDYRLLVTAMNSWGTTGVPFLDNKPGVSGLVEITYRHPALEGWELKGNIAGDTGDLYGKNLGFGLSVAKRGILKVWNK